MVTLLQFVDHGMLQLNKLVSVSWLLWLGHDRNPHLLSLAHSPACFQDSHTNIASLLWLRLPFVNEHRYSFFRLVDKTLVHMHVWY